MCYGTGQCSFTMPNRDVHVDAINIPIAMEELRIYAYGKEGGRVVSLPVGIDCTAPNICKASFPRDTKDVVLYWIDCWNIYWVFSFRYSANVKKR